MEQSYLIAAIIVVVIFLLWLGGGIFAFIAVGKNIANETFQTSKYLSEKFCGSCPGKKEGFQTMQVNDARKLGMVPGKIWLPEGFQVMNAEDRAKLSREVRAGDVPKLRLEGYQVMSAAERLQLAREARAGDVPKTSLEGFKPYESFQIMKPSDYQQMASESINTPQIKLGGGECAAGLGDTKASDAEFKFYSNMEKSTPDPLSMEGFIASKMHGGKVKESIVNNEGRQIKFAKVEPLVNNEGRQIKFSKVEGYQARNRPRSGPMIYRDTTTNYRCDNRDYKVGDDSGRIPASMATPFSSESSASIENKAYKLLHGFSE